MDTRPLLLITCLALTCPTPAQEAQNPPPVSEAEVKRIRIAVDGLSRKDHAAAMASAAAKLEGRPAETGAVALSVFKLLDGAGQHDAASSFGLQHLEDLTPGKARKSRDALSVLQSGLERAPDVPRFLGYAKQGKRIFPNGNVIRKNYGLLHQLSKATVFEVDAKTRSAMRSLAGPLLARGEQRNRFMAWTRLLGRKAPELLMPHVIGKLTPESLNGKVVLLDFFAFWCGPCKAEFKHLRELHEKHHERGLQVVSLTWFQGYFNERKTGVSDDPRRKGQKLDKETELGYLAKFREAYECPWPFVVEGEGYVKVRGLTDAYDRKNCDRYFMRWIPQLVLIDRRGVVRYIQIAGHGRETMPIAIEMLLDEPVPEQPSPKKGGR